MGTGTAIESASGCRTAARACEAVDYEHEHRRAEHEHEEQREGDPSGWAAGRVFSTGFSLPTTPAQVNA